jgi:hypothetical protein
MIKLALCVVLLCPFLVLMTSADLEVEWEAYKRFHGKSYRVQEEMAR